jgi:hypothetical protein
VPYFSHPAKLDVNFAFHFNLPQNGILITRQMQEENGGSASQNMHRPLSLSYHANFRLSLMVYTALHHEIIVQVRRPNLWATYSFIIPIKGTILTLLKLIGFFTYHP